MVRRIDALGGGYVRAAGRPHGRSKLCSDLGAVPERPLPDGLIISPVTFIELAPAFSGETALQAQFLVRNGVEWRTTWTQADTEAAHRLWADYVQKKREGNARKRAVADVLIEAFSRRF